MLMRSTLRSAAASTLAAFCLAAASSSLSAAPVLVMDVANGTVFYQEQATQPWYPASLTKLMTVYVALKAVREGRLTFDTPLVVSPYAASMSPSKMGFRPGTEVTLDNALKMLMVKSANDLAVTIAEGVSGSVEAFADEMNAAAASIGMRESRFVNPNGLPDSRQVTSARDMALLGRALYLQFPDRADLFDIGGFRLGSQVVRNHNPLLGRYPGAEGMKTGFTCSAGFNIVASATHGGRRLITVVMGAPTPAVRTAMATALFDRGFMATSSMGSIASLSSFGIAEAPDMHDRACYHRGKAAQEYMAEVQRVSLPATANAAEQAEIMPERAMLFDGAKAKAKSAMKAVVDTARVAFTPIAVYVGRAPGWSGPVAQARPANSPVGTPPPVTAYAPETKPTVLDGSAPPIAAAAADALPMHRAAAPAPQKPAKVLATRANANALGDTTEPATKLPAKPAKVAAAHRRVTMARAKPKAEPAAAKPISLVATEKRPAAKHKRVAAVKPAEGDDESAAKSVAKAKPVKVSMAKHVDKKPAAARNKAKPAKPAEAE
ncbi:MAG: D-alanyl-D-alanine carboxypeptidase family protein [Beijerinckiaceae bacterium]